MWLESVKEETNTELDINWRGFLLEQINNKQEPGWKVWDQPDDYEFRSLWALRAGEAAKKQGPKAFQKFHIALLRARHEDRVNIGDKEILMEVASSVGLDLEKLQLIWRIHR